MKKRIAVIMPYHDGMQNFIGRSIQAVANQTDVNVTLYIVDNNSTDGTPRIVADILAQEQKRNPNFWVVKIMCMKPGVAYARNAAMDEIISHKKKDNVIDAVAFCDCDDVWDLDHLKHAMIQMDQHKADMVYSDVRCVDEDGMPLSITGIPYYVQFDARNLMKQNFIFISTVVVKTDVIEHVGPFDHEADPMGDWDYWIRTSTSFGLFHYPATTITYLWKTKSGSYYDPSKMITASEYVKNKHISRKEHSDGPVSDDYSHISGWLSTAEGQTLRQYANGTCLEIGSYKGKSTCYIAEVAKSVTCIDTFLADTGGQTQSIDSTYEEFRRNTSKFSNKIRAIVGTSTDMAGLMQDGYFDMIFLDAMHDYHSVHDDLINYWNKLKIGGYMLFHDYANPDYPGVAKAVNELIGPADEVVDSIGVYKKISNFQLQNGDFLSNAIDKTIDLLQLDPIVIDENTEFAPRLNMVERYALDALQAQEKLTEQKILPPEKPQKSVVLAPFACSLPDGKVNPKNFPISEWKILVEMLRKADIYTVQIGAAGEPFIGADEMQFNPTNDTLKQIVNDMDSFVSVDTYFQHFATFHGKKGVVIFSQSDPNIFGHSSNVNLLKTNDSLRVEQFQLWTQTDYDESAFPNVINVFEEVMKLLTS